VRVDSQCAAKWHYSKRDPAGAEEMFQGAEQEYCRCVDKLCEGRELTGSDYGRLLVNMFDFYVRNAVHKNLTGKEGIDAYRIRCAFFWSKLLGKTGVITKEDIQNHVEKYWGLQILIAPGTRHFITCDHPSVWTSINDDQPDLHLLTVPITPRLMAVAFDRRILSVIEQGMTEEDYLTLNAGPMSNAVSCVYSAVPFSDEQIAQMKAHLAGKEDPGCFIEEGNWRFKIAGLRPEHYFSFMQLSPPLM